MTSVPNRPPYILAIIGIIVVAANVILFSSFDAFNVATDEFIQRKKSRFFDPKSPVIVFEVNNVNGIEGNTGSFVVQLHSFLAPKGVERFIELTNASFWDGCRFFRSTPGVGAQFGIHGDTSVQAEWQSKPIEDDVIKVTNIRPTITFAHSGQDTRTTQILINTGKNLLLDQGGWVPIGEISQGLKIVDSLYSGYENDPMTKNIPDQSRIAKEGNAYLEANFPKLSYIVRAYFKV